MKSAIKALSFLASLICYGWAIVLAISYKVSLGDKNYDFHYGPGRMLGPWAALFGTIMFLVLGILAASLFISVTWNFIQSLYSVLPGKMVYSIILTVLGTGTFVASLIFFSTISISMTKYDFPFDLWSGLGLVLFLAYLALTICLYARRAMLGEHTW